MKGREIRRMESKGRSVSARDVVGICLESLAWKLAAQPWRVVVVNASVSPLATAGIVSCKPAVDEMDIHCHFKQCRNLTLVATYAWVSDARASWRAARLGDVPL